MLEIPRTCGGSIMLVIDSREKKGSKLVELVESEALKMKIPYEKKWIVVE